MKMMEMMRKMWLLKVHLVKCCFRKGSRHRKRKRMRGKMRKKNAGVWKKCQL